MFPNIGSRSSCFRVYSRKFKLSYCVRLMTLKSTANDSSAIHEILWSWSKLTRVKVVQNLHYYFNVSSLQSKNMVIHKISGTFVELLRCKLQMLGYKRMHANAWGIRIIKYSQVLMWIFCIYWNVLVRHIALFNWSFNKKNHWLFTCYTRFQFLRITWEEFSYLSDLWIVCK